MANQDLTNLESFTSYASLDSSSASKLLAQQIITQVSASVARFCSRNFILDNYVEIQNTTQNQSRCLLRNYPLVSINSIRYGYCYCIQISYHGSAITANAQISTPLDPVDQKSYCILRTIDTSGETITKIDISLSTGTCNTTQQLATAISAVAGWTATVVGNYNVPNKWLLPTQINCLIAGSQYTQYFAYPNVDILPMSVDYRSGTVGFQPFNGISYWFPGQQQDVSGGWMKSYQTLMVDYQAGYSVVPPDLQLLVNKYCYQEFKRAKVNPALKSETLGNYSYTIQDAALLQKQFIDDLGVWRSPVMRGTGR